MSLIKCPNCKKEISNKSKICVHCGEQINTLHCKECGANIKKEDTICSKCGCPLKKDHKKLVLIIAGVLFLAGIIITIILLTNKPEKEKVEEKIVGKSDTYNIANRVSKLVEGKKEFKEYDYSEEEYSWIESVQVYVKGLDDEENDPAFSFSKYNNALEASLKTNYLKTIQWDVLEDTLKGTYFFNTFSEEIMERSHNRYFSYKNYYVMIKHRYKERFDELEKKIIDIIDDYDTNDIKKPESSEETIKEYWNNKGKNLSNYHQNILDNYNKKMNETIMMGVDILNNCSTKSCCDDAMKEFNQYKGYKEFEKSFNTVQNKYDEMINKLNNSGQEEKEKKEEEKNVETDKPVEDKKENNTKPVEKKDNNNNNNNGLRSDFKNAMDSYENFMNEYVAFMKKYNANPSDYTLLNEYSNYISKYKDFAEKFDKWKDNNMNDAETKYYIEVQTRINRKLSEVNLY